MAANDFTDICNRGCYMGRRAITNAHALARAGEYANEWHQSVCDANEDYFFLKREGVVTLSAGFDRYDFASVATVLSTSPLTVRDILSMVNDEDGSQIKRLTWEELESISTSSQDGDNNSPPVYWARINTAFRVWPAPAEATDVGVLARVAPGTLSGTDTFLVPAGWVSRLAVPYIATRLLWEDGTRDAMSMADRLNNQYEADLKQFQDAYAYGDEDHVLISPSLFRDLDVMADSSFD